MTITEMFHSLAAPEYHLSPSAIYELLEFITNKNYHWIIENSQTEIKNLEVYQKVLGALKKQVPVAYITRQKSFFKDLFYVDTRVLIPRQETELLVEAAFKWLKNHPKAQVVDIGTGSGVIGLSVKKYFPQTNVYLTDVLASALAVAKKNADKHSLKVEYLQGDFLSPLIAKQLKFGLILANPPYIAKNDPFVQPSTKFEPQNALFAPENGLKFYEQMLQQFPLIVQNLEDFCIILEFGWQQKAELEVLVKKYLDFQKITVDFLKDYSNHWRCIIIRNK